MATDSAVYVDDHIIRQTPGTDTFTVLHIVSPTRADVIAAGLRRHVALGVACVRATAGSRVFEVTASDPTPRRVDCHGRLSP